MISTSELESWQVRCGKSAFSSDKFRNSNSSFSKNTASNSCMKSWIDAFILLQDSYSEESLVLFPILAWILPSSFPSITFFSQKWFFNISCCMFNLSFLCRLDGKYRSATASLIYCFPLNTSNWISKVLQVNSFFTKVFSEDVPSDCLWSSIVGVQSQRNYARPTKLSILRWFQWNTFIFNSNVWTPHLRLFSELFSKNKF